MSSGPGRSTLHPWPQTNAGARKTKVTWKTDWTATFTACGLRSEWRVSNQAIWQSAGLRALATVCRAATPCFWWEALPAVRYTQSTVHKDLRRQCKHKLQSSVFKNTYSSQHQSTSTLLDYPWTAAGHKKTPTDHNISQSTFCKQQVLSLPNS